MGYEAQQIVAPDGTPMVILKAADFERLLALAEEGGDRLDGEAALRRIEAGEGTVPDEVLALMIDSDLTALAAWRRHRGISQAELARRTGLSQVWIGRMESGGGFGSAGARAKLARALGAPLWALDPVEDQQPVALRKERTRSVKDYDGKYAPLARWLSAHGGETISLSFDEIARLVGGLPRSAFDYQPWWQNNRGSGQALGWRTAGYVVKADLKSRTATFTREV
jgi:transcriptional regulator with XRE-family HTH domain